MRFRTKKFSKFSKGFTPMTEPVLLFSGHLRKGRFVALWNEHRIVPEARFTPWITRNTAFRIARECFYGSVRKGQGHDADEPGAALFVRDLLESGKKFFVIADVVPSAGPARVTRGIHPGRPAQRVYFKARVVGKGRPAREPADLVGFFYGIPLEGVPVLDGFGAAGEIIERENGHRQTGSDPPDLFYLLFIARSEDDFHRNWVQRLVESRREPGDCKSRDSESGYPITKDGELQPGGDNGRKRRS